MSLIYPNAILDLAPDDKQGYLAYPSPQPKEGFVLHSMVGDYAAARARLMGPDRASWFASVLKSGTVYQHFRNPWAVTWHCGVVGDNDSLTAAIGNVALIGIEHEGGPIGNVSEPLTTAQLEATIALQKWCYSVMPTLKPPALWSSHWEHRWLSATACPSSRIPWLWIMNGLKEEDMPLTDEEINKIAQTTAKLIREEGVYVRVKDGPGYIYRLTPDQELAHVKNPTVMGLQDPEWKVTDLPKDDPLWDLKVSFDGVPEELR